MSSAAGELVTESLSYDGGRQVTVYLPPDPPEAVVFAADGGWHIDRLRTAIVAANGPPAMIVAVDGLPADDGRLREYVATVDSERFAAHERFFVEDVRRWVTSRFGIALPAARTAVWGASLGGELALALGLRHRDVYGVVMAASPGAGYRPPAELSGRLPRAYLVAGTREPFFMDNATTWADALRNAGADVVMAKRDGGHGDAFWWDEFASTVTWAFDS